MHHFFVYVFALKRQAFCACRAVSVRELRTAVREEWACCSFHFSVRMLVSSFVCSFVIPEESMCRGGARGQNLELL